MDTWGRDADFDMQQKTKGLLVGLQNIKLFAVLPARHGLVYAVASAFWHALKGPHWFRLVAGLCFLHFSGLLARGDTSLMSRVRRLTVFFFFILTFSAFFGRFATALYHGMEVRGCATRVIAWA